ncbi:nitrophenyl compound nitroreductase subunit ArsF family protein [Bythopirellula goksoeyrii]|uniref:Thioredoxin domain-containing protein n=1 Tax=Bythopirellula goksoeyrii TaxID=1400387 RepID=A0A5B9QHF7_9BACT|nr:nitrophenyl compound nitroreductase subunit ArsF family protein [Bythopirellula goksoeyrii]QEG37072.1 hypothetical protein Pr1d_44120 [Bythopirellula goksoeyrii]
MNAKNLIAAALLLFVAASVAILLGREMRESTTVNSDSAEEQLPENALVVYYFHGDTRCPTCRSIESYSHEAVKSAFAAELADERVQWKVVNYEQPEHIHYATEYEIVSPTVVLVSMANGEVADWRNLMRVWELIGDRDAFTAYIQKEILSMLGS